MVCKAFLICDITCKFIKLPSWLLRIIYIVQCMKFCSIFCLLHLLMMFTSKFLTLGPLCLWDYGYKQIVIVSKTFDFPNEIPPSTNNLIKNILIYFKFRKQTHLTIVFSKCELLKESCRLVQNVIIGSEFRGSIR